MRHNVSRCLIIKGVIICISLLITHCLMLTGIMFFQDSGTVNAYKCNRSRRGDWAGWKPAPQEIPTLWTMSKPRERGNFSGCGRNNAKSGANHAVWFRRSGVLLWSVPPPAKPAAMCRVPARPCGPEKLPHRTAIILARRHDRERLLKKIWPHPDVAGICVGLNVFK